MSCLEKLLGGVEVEWKALNSVFDVYAGGDAPKGALSEIKTEEFNIPILSNGIGNKSLYGWTDKSKLKTESNYIGKRNNWLDKL